MLLQRKVQMVGGGGAVYHGGDEHFTTMGLFIYFTLVNSPACTSPDNKKHFYTNFLHYLQQGF